MYLLALRVILQEHDEAMSDLLLECERSDVKLIRSILLAQISIYEKLQNNNESILKNAERLYDLDTNRKGYYHQIIRKYS